MPLGPIAELYYTYTTSTVLWTDLLHTTLARAWGRVEAGRRRASSRPLDV